MALPMNHAFDEHNAERLRAAETVLLGATTYRGFVSFWPHALEMPGLTAPGREIAERYAAGLEVVTVSDSLTQDDAGPWAEQTRIVPVPTARTPCAACATARAETFSSSAVRRCGTPCSPSASSMSST
jgi:hypothetical protein